MAQASALKQKKCVPCEGGVPKLTKSRIDELLTQVRGWRLTPEGTRIRKDWLARDFKSGIEFFNRVSELAESENHHPDVHLEGYRKVWIEIWTHAIGGLSENDFILAAKIDDLPIEVKVRG